MRHPRSSHGCGISPEPGVSRFLRPYKTSRSRFRLTWFRITRCVVPHPLHSSPTVEIQATTTTPQAASVAATAAGAVVQVTGTPRPRSPVLSRRGSPCLRLSTPNEIVLIFNRGRSPCRPPAMRGGGMIGLQRVFLANAVATPGRRPRPCPSADRGTVPQW